MVATMSIGHQFVLHNKHIRHTAKHCIDHAPDDARVKITAPKRTLPQNALFHVLLGELSRAKPAGREATPEVWKAIMMHACGHEVQFTMGIDGSYFPLGMSSSKLTVEQFSLLIECVYKYGAENGVEFSR